MPLAGPPNILNARGHHVVGRWKLATLSRQSSLLLVSLVLFALAMPGRPLPAVAWVAMVPFFYCLRDVGFWRGCYIGMFFGWAVWFTSTWWLQHPLTHILGWASSASVLFVAGACLATGFPYALAAGLVCRFPGGGLLGTARDAAIFTVAITFLTPVFQGNLAHSQYQLPLVIQIAELGGVPLLLFAILWFNRLLAEWIAAPRPRRVATSRYLGIAATLLAGVFGYGAIRMYQMNADSLQGAPTFVVGAVQPNFPVPIHASRQPDPGSRSNDLSSALEQVKSLAARNPDVDLIALPENPRTFLFNEDAAGRHAVGNTIREIGRPLLLCVDAIESPAKGSVPKRFNVAVLIDTNRNLAGHYAKMKRIPVVEYLPGEARFPFLRTAFPNSQKVQKGEGIKVFPANSNVTVIPLICYEGTSSAHVREFVRQGGNVCVNLVNDSWFLRTPASEMHLALALFRTVEYRIPLVRVANSGVGAHIGADGQIVAGSRTELFRKSETAFPLLLPGTQTLYFKLGDWWMLSLLLLLVPQRCFRRSSTP